MATKKAPKKPIPTPDLTAPVDYLAAWFIPKGDRKWWAIRPYDGADESNDANNPLHTSRGVQCCKRGHDTAKLAHTHGMKLWKPKPAEDGKDDSGETA